MLYVLGVILVVAFIIKVSINGIPSNAESTYKTATTATIPYSDCSKSDVDVVVKKVTKKTSKLISEQAKNTKKKTGKKNDGKSKKKKEEKEKTYTTYYTESDVVTLAKVLYREAGGIPSKTEQACVAWVACNRVDAGWGSSVTAVLTAPNQFAYYSGTPVYDNMYSLAKDVLTRWSKEKSGWKDVGRVLPKSYLYFHGDGRHNYFRQGYNSSGYWDYSLPSPYAN